MSARKSKPSTAPPPIADAQLVTKKAKFVFRVTEYEATYLQVGDVIPFQGREFVVESVNSSCARVVPATEGTPRKVTFQPKFADAPVSFTAPERNNAISISANSEVQILRRLGAAWREKL